MFNKICAALGIRFWSLSRGNHKSLSIERYHWFLKKTQTVVVNDHGIHMSFIENSKTSQYAWNSAPIDNMDILRCVAAVGRHFQFPMDVDLKDAPSINCDDQLALYSYLRDVSNVSQLSTSVHQILIKYRRTTRCI